MKLTVNTFLTLDGVMQGPGGREEDTSGGFERGGWLVPLADEGMGRIVSGWFADADAFLLGRTTFQLFQPYWEQITDPENDVAQALNNLPKYVASTTLVNPTWTKSTVLSTDVLDAVATLKAQPGRELQVHGSCKLAHALHDAGLVDEYRLFYFPVVVGQGKRLFEADTAPSGFTLVGCEQTGAGAVCLTLRPKAFSTGDFEVQDGMEAVREQP